MSLLFFISFLVQKLRILKKRQMVTRIWRAFFFLATVLNLTLFEQIHPITYLTEEDGALCVKQVYARSPFN